MPAATPAPGSAATIAPTATQPTDAALIQNITQTAQAFLGGLDDAQRAKATYAFDNAERLRWHWTTPRNFPRNGLPLTEMSAEQKAAAHALLQASVSAAGYEKSLNIMVLQNDLGNDPELYFVTVFGAPGERAWGWRWEGHHLSRQFTIVGDQIAMTPFFLGAWPTVNGAGLRASRQLERSVLFARHRPQPGARNRGFAVGGGQAHHPHPLSPRPRGQHGRGEERRRRPRPTPAPMTSR